MSEFIGNIRTRVFAQLQRLPSAAGRQRRAVTLLNGPLEGMVYARHGHDLMGWKSPVGVPVMET